MTKKILSLFIIFLASHSLLKAQNKYTISGEVKDAQSGEALIGVSVFVEQKKNVGTTTNSYGFYSITLPEGAYTLVFQSTSYERKTREIDLNKNTKLVMELSAKSQALNEVVVSAKRNNRNVTSTQVGVNKISISEIKNVPVIFGEKDVLKTIQLLPGIKSGGEGSASISVRGGGYDQNLVLLDEAPVYNAAHLLGFVSTFNSDAIKDVSVYKAGFPAAYGGRLSSVIDIKMNDGNNKKLGVSGGIGTIASRLTVEAPIVKDKGSFIISGRRTYADAFLKLSKKQEIKNTVLYFYDLNAKANYKLGKKDKIFLSGYFGRDNFNFDKNFSFAWGNATSTLRWNHLFGERIFSNTSLLFSSYNYSIGLGKGTDRTKIEARIQDFSAKTDFQYNINSNNTLRFGITATQHKFLPAKISAGTSSSINNKSIDEQWAIESGIYLDNEQSVGENFKINYGVRYSNFRAIGPGKVYSYFADGRKKDSIIYKKGDLKKQYGGFEPRINATFVLNNSSSIKASYTRTQQFIHLLSNSTSSTPVDLWVPSSTIVKPQIADQYSLGLYKNFSNNAVETSIEGYYKSFKNQIDYRNGAVIAFNELVESELVFGKGWSYGVELFVKKKIGRLSGWVSYTLSRTKRQFSQINNGKAFSANYDAIHDASLVGIYSLSKKWTLSANWVYRTGRAITFPTGRYEVNGEVVPLYTERNAYRMPAYHRLDFGATVITRKTKKFEGSWNFSLFNVYGRQNPFTIEFRKKDNNPNKQTEAVQLSLFRWVPSVTYNFKF
jgi:hypothetical protein